MGALRYRLAGSVRAAGLHFACSLAVASLAAALIFKIWYPAPLADLMGGTELFLLLMSVDVVCGPLLTLMVYSPTKPTRERWTDLSIIVVLQAAALVYGLVVVHVARPVFIGHEGDRFRVVRASDIDPQALEKAAEPWKHLPQWGPVPIGVRLVQDTDPDFYNSIRLALEGLHPSMRPERWQAYAATVNAAQSSIKNLSDLEHKHKDRPEWTQLLGTLTRLQKQPADMGYVPLLAGRHSDWVVVVDRQSGVLVTYAHLDGW
jgi:hypothetical protein